MVYVRQEAPAWFKAATVILLIWGLVGCYACAQQFRLGPEAMGTPSAYDRALYARLPYGTTRSMRLRSAPGCSARSRWRRDRSSRDRCTPFRSSPS